MSSVVGFNLTMENILIATRILLLCQVIIILAIWLRRRGTVTIKRVIDGDTVIDDADNRIRIAAIDAPEIGQPGADEATVALRNLVQGEHVQLSGTGRDKYGRLVRKLFVRGRDVGNVMLKRGLARRG